MVICTFPMKLLFFSIHAKSKEQEPNIGTHRTCISLTTLLFFSVKTLVSFVGTSVLSYVSIRKNENSYPCIYWEQHFLDLPLSTLC